MSIAKLQNLKINIEQNLEYPNEINGGVLGLGSGLSQVINGSLK